jgi:hypothetical protein
MHLLDMQNLDILLCRNWIEEVEHMRSKPVTAQRIIINVFIACVVLPVTPLFGQLTWEQVVGDTASVPAGFGEWQNERYDSMAVYDGYLYVATYNWNTGAEVWRTADGTTWNQVNTDGFGDANNQGLSAMAEFNGFLYAGTTNTYSGGEVWRTDGTTWTQVNADGFGDGTNSGVSSLVVFGGELYAGTRNGYSGVEVWHTPDGTNWTQGNSDGFNGDSNNLSASAAAVFSGSLFVGTGQTDFPTGTEVWASDDGTAWTQANTDGFGDANNQSAAAMQEYSGYLYLSTFGLTGTEVWRTNDGTSWGQVNTDGFGDANNRSSSNSMAIFDAGLFVGTGSEESGAEVWRTNDGTTWEQANVNGFGGTGNRTISTLIVFNGQLYVGTSGNVEIWRASAPPLFVDGFESGDTSAWSSTVE